MYWYCCGITLNQGLLPLGAEVVLGVFRRGYVVALALLLHRRFCHTSKLRV